MWHNIEYFMFYRIHVYTERILSVVEYCLFVQISCFQ